MPTDRANISRQCPQAQDLFTDLANDRAIDKAELTASPRTPAHAVRIQILNGTDTSGRQAKPPNSCARPATRSRAPTTRRRAGATTVTYPPGLEKQARALAARLRTPATPEADQNSTPGAVTLTVGPAYTGLHL
ncbi:hypothetical protein F0344_17910 [Streptomyces finlayi]|uniref:LytR/CpsA/Psr regulator C-terminal domain-containing protein n=1 Tax=Streptomyces finlayi TaxID=67296 RepID=A0A7G7BLN0_9ACTN|nr:LytR C-terminal domain-containing protein [Streptomyces finlayi]QNE76245.1 hypothetical protein F0344_17910 [Streptomyces finlayi]